MQMAHDATTGFRGIAADTTGGARTARGRSWLWKLAMLLVVLAVLAFASEVAASGSGQQIPPRTLPQPGPPPSTVGL